MEMLELLIYGGRNRFNVSRMAFLQKVDVNIFKDSEARRREQKGRLMIWWKAAKIT